MAGCVEETALLARVIDFVDAPSLNFQHRSGYDRAPFGIAARLEARRRVAFGDEGAEKRARPVETALRAVAIEFRNESRNQCEAAPIRAALVGLIPSGLIPFGFVRFGCRRLIRDLLRGAEQAPAAPGGEQQRNRQRRLLERRPSKSGDRSGEQNSRDDSHLGPQWLRQAAASAKEPEQQRCERGVGGEPGRNSRLGQRLVATIYK